MVDYENIFELYQKVISAKPLVLNLTNSVTQDFMANVLLSLGALPIMSSSIDEISELIAISSSVNINIGTLNSQFIDLARHGVKEAKSKNKCIILDPVGAGASHIRTHAAIEFSNYADIIRGNSSEIMALVQDDIITCGVESTHQSQDAIESARFLAKKYKSVIAISGQTDYIINFDSIIQNYYGDELMTKVTGMGCALGAVIAAFAGVEKDYFLATSAAILFYTLAAMDARRRADKPARFRVEFIDSLFAPDWGFISDMLGKDK